MKNIILSIALGASLLFGGVNAFAGNNNKKSNDYLDFIIYTYTYSVATPDNKAYADALNAKKIAEKAEKRNIDAGDEYVYQYVWMCCTSK